MLTTFTFIGMTIGLILLAISNDQHIKELEQKNHQLQIQSDWFNAELVEKEIEVDVLKEELHDLGRWHLDGGFA